jgi:hypothetical protein
MATPTGLEPDRESIAALTSFLMRRMLVAKRAKLLQFDLAGLLLPVLGRSVVLALAACARKMDHFPHGSSAPAPDPTR